MANNFSKYQEIILKTSMSFDDIDTKRLETLAKNAGDLMAKGLVKELGVALDEIGNMFNAKLKEMGQSEIDFSDMIKMPDSSTLSKMTSVFAQAIANNVSSGIVSGVKAGVKTALSGSELAASLAKEQKALEREIKLLKQRERLLKYAHTLSSETAEGVGVYDKDQMNEMKDMGYRGAINKTFRNYRWKKRGNIQSMSTEIEDAQNALIDSVSEIEKIGETAIQAGKKLKIQDIESQLFKAVEAISTMREMIASVADMPVELRAPIKKKIGDVEELTYFSDEFAEMTDMYSVEDYFPRLLKRYGISTGGEYNTPSAISERIEADTSRLKEIQIELQNVQKQANSTAVALDDVDTALTKRYQSGKAKPIAQTEINKVQSAIEGKFNKHDTLTGLLRQYDDAVASGDFVEQYKALLKFTSLYQDKKNSGKNVDAYTERFEQLSGFIDVARTSLEEFIAKANEINASKTSRRGFEQKLAGAAISAIQGRGEAVPGIMQPGSATQGDDHVENNQDAANAAIVEADAQERITQELEGQHRILLYHRTDNGFDKTLVGGPNGDDIRNIKQTLYEGFGGFGDGHFASTLAGAELLSDKAVDGTEQFYEFDASEYNLYIAKSVEHAEQLRKFLMNLQRIVGDGAPFDDLNDEFVDQEIDVLDEEQLYQQTRALFTNFNMTREEFHKWIEAAQQQSRQLHDMLRSGESPDDMHNFGTRWMKGLGYEGVLNDFPDDPEYSADFQGSVVYDIDPNKITQVFENKEEYLKYIQAQIDAHQQNTAAIQQEAHAQEELNNTDAGNTRLQRLEELKNKIEELKEKIRENIMLGKDDPYYDQRIKDTETLIALQKEYISLGGNPVTEEDDDETPYDFEKDILLRSDKNLLQEIDDLKEYKTAAQEARRVQEEFAGVDLSGYSHVQDVIQDVTSGFKDSATAIKEINALIKTQDQLKTLNADSNDINTLKETLAKREQIVETLRHEAGISLLTDDAYFKENQAIKEKIRLLQDAAAEQERLKASANVVASSSGTATTGEVELNNLEAIRQRVAEITAAVNDKTAAFTAEEAEVQRVVNEEVAHLDKLEDKIQNIKATLEGLMTNIKAGEADIGAGLSNIVVNVNGATDKQEGLSIDEEQFKNILSAIVYNVKVVMDDDIADNADSSQSPWALEATLKGETNTRLDAIKGVLDSIATSNTKETDIAFIKTAVESINKKIVQGTKVIEKESTTSANKKSKSVASATQSPSGSDSKNAKVRATELKQLEIMYKNLGKLQAQYDEVAKTKVAQLQAEIDKKTKSLNLTVEELDALKQVTESAKADEVELLRAANAQNKKTQQTKEELKLVKEKAKLAKKEALLGKATGAISRAESTWLGATGIDGNATPEMDARLDNYYNKIVALRNLQDKLSKQETVDPQSEEVKYLRQQIQLLNKDTAEMNELLAQYERYSGNNAMEIQGSVVNPSVNIAEYKKQLTDLVKAHYDGKVSIKGFNDQTNELIYTVQERGSRAITTYNATLTQLDGKVKTVAKSTKQAETFFEASMRKFKEISSYISAMSVFSWFGRQLRQGLQYVKEIDLAMTELRKVTDETEETYDKFLTTASKTAEKVGSTMRDVISSTADWARLGYSMKEAARLAESTQILMNVSEFTNISDATDSLISSIQAFKYTAEQSMDVVDIMNTIGKHNCRNHIVIYG